MITASVRHRPLPSGTRGSPIVVVTPWHVCKDDLGLWPAAYPIMAVRGHDQSTFIGVIITGMILLFVLPSGRRGPLVIKDVIVVILAVGVV